MTDLQIIKINCRGSSNYTHSTKANLLSDSQRDRLFLGVYSKTQISPQNLPINTPVSRCPTFGLFRLCDYLYIIF